MQKADIVAKPLQWGSALRRRRVFHPSGVLAHGSLERAAAVGDGLPLTTSDDVLARVSKAVGLPGTLPDLIGLALRMPPQHPAATPWDILLASAGAGLLTRFALRPVTSWTASMSSLMPYTFDGRYWWVRAELVTPIGDTGLSLDRVAEQITREGIEFRLDQACGTEDFAPLARLTLKDVVPGGPSRDVAFDPTINSAPGVALAPEWLTDLRRRAYERSREGRGAE